MKTIQQIPFAVLGAGAAFTVLWGVADPVAAYAEVKVVEADGYYIMGDGPEENQSVAKERARAEAKRIASEQVGIYVESFSEVKMGELSRDEIRAISANVMEVQEETVTPELLGDSTIRYHCHVKASVDTSNITQQLQQDRMKFEESVRRNKEMEEQLARVNAELAELKERYKNATEEEQQEINLEVKRNEDAFTATQWNEKGCELYDKKDYHGAIECYQKAIEFDQNFAYPWNNMGSAYNRLGDYIEAIKCCQTAIEIDPDNAIPWSNMGYACVELGKEDKAIEYYQRSIELDPDNAVSWSNMGYAYDNLGDYEKAIECHKKAVALDPENAVSWGNMGHAYYNQKDYEKAIECYEKAVELDPDNEISWNKLGYAYNNLGNYDEAIECFQEALEIDPDYGNAKDGLAFAQENL